MLFVFKRLLLRVYKEPIRNLHQLFPQLFRQLFKSFNNCLLHCFICSGIVSKVSTIYQIFLQNIENMLYFPTIASTMYKQFATISPETITNIFNMCCVLLWPQHAMQTWVSLSTKRGQYVCIQPFDVLNF